MESKTKNFFEVRNPATQELETLSPLATPEEHLQAVQAAETAFKTWRNTPVSSRQRILMDFVHLIKKHTDDIANMIVKENGKTITDARGDVFRGLEVVEFSTSVASHLMGETVEALARNVDTYSFRQPLGVAAGICPFNFPAMIPLWMFPMAIACGNTYVLKPSERTPGAAMLLAKLTKEAGLPNGVLNIVHGQVVRDIT